MTTFREIVAGHHRESEAVLLAGREPCITIAQDERRNVKGRRFRILNPEDLNAYIPRPSWLMAVLLCPGDDTMGLTTWAEGGGHAPERVIFYFHAETDAREALGAWHEAGKPIHSWWTIRDWKGLHRHFGEAWNVRIFDDFRGSQ